MENCETNTFYCCGKKLRFPGQYYDSETGLHYNYHRYYDPSIGRYLTPDPIGLSGGSNLFAYVYNDPINKIDIKGLRWWTGAGTVTNRTQTTIKVTGDTKGGGKAEVTIEPGESYNFNYAWLEAIKERNFEGRLLDPDFVVVPGESEPRKIKPFPWEEVIIESIEKPKKDEDKKCN